MEVVNARSALLSNYEVLTLLKELESDQLARTKTALKIKKEEEHAGIEGTRTHHHVVEEVCENLRTVEFEAIQYLTAEYQPTHAQSDERISQLVKDLAPYDFTKAEKLQVVNLAPTTPVELYVIIEELEDRIGDKMDQVLQLVKRSIPDQHVEAMASGQTNNMESIDYTPVELVYPEGDADMGVWDYEQNQDEYDDAGEGAGVEGDLEMDDD